MRIREKFLSEEVNQDAEFSLKEMEEDILRIALAYRPKSLLPDGALFAFDLPIRFKLLGRFRTMRREFSVTMFIVIDDIAYVIKLSQKFVLLDLDNL